MRMERKGIVMAAGFMVALFFASAPVYAETVWKEGPVECLGIKTTGYSLVTNESWLKDVDGANSCTQYAWQYFNRDAAMETINMLSNIVLKKQSLCDIFIYENKNTIKKKQERPYNVLVNLFDNGIIQIEMFDQNTGRFETWRFK